MSSTSINNNSNVTTYKWAISNFSQSDCTSTPYFGFPVDNGTQFQLYINPSFTSNHWCYNCVSICVYLRSCNQDRLKAKHRMWILNAKGGRCNTQEGISIFMKNKFSAQYNIHRDVLMDSAYGMLLNDTLTVECEIELVNDGEDLEVKQEGYFSSISKHYESLLESGKHSDVVLAIGQKEFHVHKIILSARSPVFAAMFDHSDTKEAQQGRVEIVDVDVEVFELFLLYLYTDKIDQLDRFAPELLVVADMYQMDCLKSLCEHFLCSTFTIENVSELLVHADLYRAEVLKSKCAVYITNNSEKVKLTEGWKTVATKADLLALLYDKLSIKHSSC